MKKQSNFKKYENDHRSCQEIISDFYWADKRCEDDIPMLTGIILINDYENILSKFNNKYSFKCFLHHMASLPMSFVKIFFCIFKQLLKGNK